MDGTRTEDAPLRPREKMWLHGPEALSDPELLSVLLGSACAARSVFEVAREVLPPGAGLGSLQARGRDELLAVRGLGQAGAARIAALLEAASRLARARRRPGLRIGTARDVHDLLGPEAASSREERVWVVALDVRRGMLGSRCVSVGSLTSSIVHPREVYRPALSLGAAALVLAHNHPSGDPTPSAEDHAVTQRVAAAGELLGIELLDHVVLCADCWYSFREAGWLPLPGDRDGG